jgi:glycine/serine hydroxymethyltransferase
MKTSGIRLGSPACTTRGFGSSEFIEIGQIISDVIFELDSSSLISDENEKIILKKTLPKNSSHLIFYRLLF